MQMNGLLGSHLVVSLALLPLACGSPGQADDDLADPTEDLPLGDMSEEDIKADGGWGAALTCKPIPALPTLPHPEITVSLNGLTLHLVDRTVGYDRVFPIGAGAVNGKTWESTYGESLSYYPILATDSNDFTIRTSQIEPCKTWWTDSATGQRSPVFAGLPFIRWWGSYGIHGPIDNFRAPNGGDLRRGFVSHGCFRMEAADVLEVYARIRGVATVPLHIQREPERTAEGTRVDVPQKWVGSECAADSDCNYAGGFCKANFFGRGFCSARCTGYCADQAGAPQTFCTADPDDATQGMCVIKATAQNFECRPYDHLTPTVVTRFRQSATATVCMPGSPGWIGDRCFLDGDCDDGLECAGATGTEPGICTVACTRYCSDQPGAPPTFCVNEPDLGGATCLRQCTPSSNASECPADHDCVSRSRNGDPSTVRNVCVPR